jgi:tripartite-type tricarboxylate transporter receptor subunit TctC
MKLNWVGSLNSVVNVLAISHERPFRYVKDVFEKEVILSGETGSDGTVTARLLNEIIGTKFKVVLGYTGTSQAMLAVVQGEVDGTANVSWDIMKATSTDLLDRHQLRLLMQIAPQRAADLGDTPFVMDFVKTDEDRLILNLLLAKLQYGRPVVAPPGTSLEALRELRRAFLAMSKDKEFLEEAARRQLEINPTSGDDMQAFISGIYRTPLDVVEKGAILLRKAGAIGVP